MTKLVQDFFNAREGASVAPPELEAILVEFADWMGEGSEPISYNDSLAPEREPEPEEGEYDDQPFHIIDAEMLARTYHGVPDDASTPAHVLERGDAAETLVQALENSIAADLPGDARGIVIQLLLLLFDMDDYRQWCDRSLGTDANSLVQMAQHMPGQTYEAQADVMDQLDGRVDIPDVPSVVPPNNAHNGLPLDKDPMEG